MNDIDRMQMIDHRKHLCGKDHHNHFVQMPFGGRPILIANVENRAVVGMLGHQHARIVADQRVLDAHVGR